MQGDDLANWLAGAEVRGGRYLWRTDEQIGFLLLGVQSQERGWRRGLAQSIWFRTLRRHTGMAECCFAFFFQVSERISHDLLDGDRIPSLDEGGIKQA